MRLRAGGPRRTFLGKAGGKHLVVNGTFIHLNSISISIQFKGFIQSKISFVSTTFFNKKNSLK